MHISIHSLRMEGDTDIRNISIQEIYFNPLPPHGGRPRRPADTLQERVISIHSLRMEGDSVVLRWIRAVDYFNPLPPHGGRLYEVSADWLIGTFQSTPSAWRETHTKKSDRKERDISIHSLRMEGDKNFLSMTSCNCIFQSTPSAWRETQERCQIVFPAMDFNPLPPHGGRPFPSMVVIYNGYFNPLPPHGGRLHDAA